MWRSCSAWWYKVLTQSSTAHWHGLLLLAGEVHTLSYFTMTISVDTTTMLSLHYYHYHDVLWRPPLTCCHCTASDAPCTIMSVPCLLWLPPTTCSHHTTSVDTKDVAYYVAVVQCLVVQGTDTVRNSSLAWTPATTR